MASTVARNKTDVDNMTRRERLWDSLNYSYGKKRENSDKEYAKAYSQADNQLLGRGMQRSSYGAQTLANIDKQRIDTQNDIYDAQIADYENRLQDLEAQDLAADQWERQFAEGQRQYNTSLAFQQSEADRAQGNADRSFNLQLQQYGDSRKDADWEKAFQERQYGDSRADTAWNQAFQQSQANLAQSQWEREFDRSGDDSDRQIAMGYISQIAAAGGNPSDDLLRRAGLSRPDYNAMLMQAQAAGGATSGGSGGNGGNRSLGGNSTAINDAYNALVAASGNGGNANNSSNFLDLALNWQPSGKSTTQPFYGTPTSVPSGNAARGSDVRTVNVNGINKNMYSLIGNPNLKTIKK